MVKGISKQVIGVGQRVASLFEMVFFLVRDDAGVVWEGELVRLANEGALYYVRRHAGGEKRTRRFRWNAAGFMLLGAFVTGVAWVLSAVL